MKPEPSSEGDRRERRLRDLFVRYYRPINLYFHRLGFSREDSDDLAQETFFRAYRGLGRFRGEAGSNTWLFTIAKNVGLNAVRGQQAGKRSGREIDIDSLDAESPPQAAGVEEGDQKERGTSRLPDAGPDPLDGILSGERRKLLREALEALPDRMQRTVYLHVYQDLAYREIAEILKVSIQTVRSQLHQARKRLAPILSAQFSDLEFASEEPPLADSSPLES